MLYRVTHETVYAYDEPVTVSHNVLHLRPRDLPRQRLRRNDLHIEPWPAVASHRTDYFGNPTTFTAIQQPHAAVSFRAVSEVEIDADHQLQLGASCPWESVRDALRDDRSPEGLRAYQFAFDSPLVAAEERYAAYARASFPAGRRIDDAAFDLMHRLHAGFAYDPTATTVATPLAEAFEKRRGVCQDLAHVMIACLRSLGLPARYVSGYLRTFRDPGKVPSDARLIGADASHAWVGVFCPGLGWIDFDPTNDCIPADHHVTLAWGRDYSDVSPIKGMILGGGAHTVDVRVHVEALG